MPDRGGPLGFGFLGDNGDDDDERELFTTRPHAAQTVVLADDADRPANRIYRLEDDRGRAVPILGSELKSLCEWYMQTESFRAEGDRA